MSELYAQAERLAALERQLELAERYSIRSFWHTLDRAYETIIPQRRIACIVCGHDDFRSGYETLAEKCMFGGGNLERYRCPACEAVFGPLKYLDAPADLVDLDYQLLYARYSEADLTEVEIEVFRALAPQRDGVYLNWGSGGAWSRTIATLREQGWNVWGYEPSAAADSPFVVRSPEQLLPAYDGIFSNNVIEHFRTPVGQFEQFHALLKPNGVMAHGSPCYDYQYAFTRFHTLFLLGRSPERLAERTSFRISGRSEYGQAKIVVFERGA